MYFSRLRHRLSMRLRMTVAADFSVRRRREAHITKTMTINQANGIPFFRALPDKTQPQSDDKKHGK
jgi:hypothetical protein